MNDQAQKLRELAGMRESAGASVESGLCGAKTDFSTCRSIAVTSGKGGVGKTNISLFLAVSLALERKKVLLLDADLGLANVHILTGMAPKRNLSHFFDGKCPLDQVVCKGPAGIDILPGASGLENLANLDIGRIELLRHEFLNLEKNYDYLLIDTGAGIGTSVTQFASNADLALLVMTPEPTSLTDAYAMVKVLYEKGISRIGTVVNMALSDRDGSETFDRLNAIVVKFLKRPLEMLGTLPFDRELSRCVRNQKLFVLEKGGNQFSMRIKTIAGKIRGISRSPGKGFFAKFAASLRSRGMV